MRSVGSILLLVLIFSQVGLKPAIVLNWKINQDLITQKYCVNKDRPVMHCDGKCYLAKQLRKLDFEEKEERSKNRLPEERLKQLEIPFLIPVLEMNAVSSHAVSMVRSGKYSEKFDNYSFSYLKSCFHPPQKVKEIVLFLV